MSVERESRAVSFFAQNQVGEVRVGRRAGTLNTNSNASGRNTPLIFQQNSRSEVRVVGGKKPVAGAVTSEPWAQCQNYLKQHSTVRRLTENECLKLQGFLAGYLDIEYKGKPAAAGPKYKAIGNSFAVPCVRWIGERVQAIEDAEQDEVVE